MMNCPARAPDWLLETQVSMSLETPNADDEMMEMTRGADYDLNEIGEGESGRDLEQFLD
jgi:hypothetical protein